MKKKVAWITLIIAVCFGAAGFIVPPTGIIDSSVLWLISQFLLYGSACLGIDAKFTSANNPPTLP